MKFSQRLIGPGFALGLIFLPRVDASAQTQTLEANRALVSAGQPAPPPAIHSRHEPLTATVVDGTDAPVATLTREGIFGLVGLKHDHTVDVTVQYPVSSAGRVISAEALDGGQVIVPGRNLTVAPDGRISFKFRAGHAVGSYQVALRDGTDEVGLQFWVLDEQHPENNRPVVNPSK
jgi:hypothetical protein